jgi:hypothetical protein
MDKANHTVTVPRLYLEELEKLYNEMKEQRYNMRGDIRKVMLPPNASSPVARESQTLFITDDNIKMDSVVIIDEEGRERGRFIRNAFYDKF